MEVLDFLFISIGLLSGILFAWLILRYKFRLDKEEEVKRRIIDQYVPLEYYNLLERQLYEQKEINTSLEDRLLDLTKSLSAREQDLFYLQEKLVVQKEEVERLNQKMHNEFENLAFKILQENSREFSHQNKKQIDDILQPLKVRIEGFEKKVGEVYDHEAKQRSELKGEIKVLLELNQKISEEANNLSRALKGDQKIQGNWGELILEKILERSGLEKGVEYSSQYSDVSQDGKKIQPDIIVNLPDNKHIIIDSKVPLTAYEEYINSVPDGKKTDRLLKKHILSVRNHISNLSEKNYPSASNLTNPDFVLLFIPIESSFSLALKYDDQLFNYAWDKKIVIVSPTTFLATLKTVSSLWKQVKQNKHAFEIARQAGNLYDKFVAFTDDMKKISGGIDQAQKAYDNAINKLSTGTGNLIKRTQTLKSLGIKAKKNLPREWIDFESKE